LELFIDPVSNRVVDARSGDTLRSEIFDRKEHQLRFTIHDREDRPYVEVVFGMEHTSLAPDHKRRLATFRFIEAYRLFEGGYVAIEEAHPLVDRVREFIRARYLSTGDITNVVEFILGDPRRRR
jgi:hypothetical protein